MSRKSPVPKMIGWTSVALAAFTTISIIVPILWEKAAQREKK
jgi:hypothetical protein